MNVWFINAQNPNSTKTQTVSYEVASYTDDDYLIDETKSSILASPILSVGSIAQISISKSSLIVGK